MLDVQVRRIEVVKPPNFSADTLEARRAGLASSAPASVLVVDDRADKLLVLGTLLEPLGQNVVLANSGEEALKHLLECEFAVILMDVNMPTMDGLETAALIRGRRKTAHTPIIFITAYADEMHTARGYSLSAVDYILTPIVPDVLRTKVKVFCDLYLMANQIRDQAEQRVAFAHEQAARLAAEETNRLLREADKRKDEHEQELIAARKAAEKANAAKSDFLSSMSHELRTPLNAILGFAQLIESDSQLPTPSQQQSVGEILKAGWYLLELINEILDLALIESGKLALSLEPISLADVVRECQAMIDPQAQERDIRITFSQFEVPCFVKADRTRLKQVLINLLSNAVKYSKRGGRIDVDCIASAAGRIRVCIKDSGEGLTPDKLTKLFQPFNRLGQETGSVEGTGIGLVVSKRLVELMEGDIGVESTVGVGSAFWIELNQTVEPQTAAGEAEPTAAGRGQVQAGAKLRTLLYVEDNPANLKLVEDLTARRSDLRLLSAKDGKSGIDIARASLPDLILMDINLPDISGIKAMQILRADAATAHIPVVALSANAIPRDIERGLQSGFFRYLTKPIKIRDFMDSLDAALEIAEKQPVSAGKSIIPNRAAEAAHRLLSAR